jgi:hypothetical protein
MFSQNETQGQMKRLADSDFRGRRCIQRCAAGLNQSLVRGSHRLVLNTPRVCIRGMDQSARGPVRSVSLYRMHVLNSII